MNNPASPRPESHKLLNSHPLSSNDMETGGPPPLPYNLREHKPAIIIAFSVMLLFDCLLQVAVFYPLHFYTNLNEKIVFAIVAAPGAWSILDLARRTWRMVQKSDEYRPLNSGRWTVSHSQSSTRPSNFKVLTAPCLVGSLSNQLCGQLPIYHHLLCSRLRRGQPIHLLFANPIPHHPRGPSASTWRCGEHVRARKSDAIQVFFAASGLTRSSPRLLHRRRHCRR